MEVKSDMKKLVTGGVFFLLVFLASCRPTSETVTEVDNGPFKILVRSQEFHHSAIFNVDICVEATSVHDFPKTKAQCFLHGFDFDGLSVKWLSQREIEIFFRGGRVTEFRNDASVWPNGPVPEEFHAILCDGCDAGSKDAASGKTK